MGGASRQRGPQPKGQRLCYPTVCSRRRYDVSGALEHAPKIGVARKPHRSISAGSVRREARAVPVARRLDRPADRLSFPGLLLLLFRLAGPTSEFSTRRRVILACRLGRRISWRDVEVNRRLFGRHGEAAARFVQRSALSAEVGWAPRRFLRKRKSRRPPGHDG